VERTRLRRDALENAGIVTGSLPSTVLDLGGQWDDKFGGKVVGYQRWITENYPEIS